MLDVGLEAGLVNGSIKHGGRGQAFKAQRGNDRASLPVPARRVIPQSRAARTSAVASDQVCGHAAFIEEDIRARVPEWEPVAPASPLSDDVWTPLFVGVNRFF